LYDLEIDPTEQNNLVEARPDKLVELKALLDAHKAAGIDPLYPYVVEMPVGIDKSLEKHFESGDEYIYWPN
jgi:uncharacterized sulfatase